MSKILFNSISNTNIPIAVTDIELTLEYGNKNFYALIGTELFFSVYSVVLEQERELLKSCISNIKSQGCVSDIFSILYTDKKYHHMLLNFTYLENNNMIKIEFNYISELLLENSRLSFELNQYRSVLSLDGGTMFEYIRATNTFKLYWINNSQNIYIYNGDFDTWIRHSQNLISKSDRETFNELCSSIKAELDDFEYELASSILSNGEILESTKIKGITLKDYNGENKVIGIWTLYNTILNQKENHFIDTMYKDGLTNLLNKQEISKYIKNRLKSNPDVRIYLCIIDLDNFKQCNDTYGHLFGDEILKSVSKIIQNSLQDNGVAGRIGGDEFLITIEGCENENAVRNILRSIRANIQWLYSNKLSSIQLSCSMGISTYPTDSNDYQTLFHLADHALYIAKTKGKSRYIIYDSNKHGIPNININDNSIITTKFDVNYIDAVSKLKTAIKNTYKNGILGIDDLFSCLLSAYYIQNIVVYTKCCYNISFCRQLPQMFNSSYLEHFNLENFYIVENTKILEFTASEVYSYYEATDYNSFFQHILYDNNGNVFGIVSYERSTTHRIWSPSAVSTLSLISAILESVLI